MTNLPAILVLTLLTNVSNVQVHENCELCEVTPAQPHENVPLVYTTYPATIIPPRPRNVRRETTEIIEQASVTFEYEGIKRTLPFHNRVVSRTVRRFKPVQVEEEVK